MKRSILILTFVLVASAAHADVPKQYQHGIAIGGTTSGAVLIVGWTRDESKIAQLVELTSRHADEAYRTIKNDVARLNASSVQGPIAVGWQTAECVAAAQQIAEWTRLDVLAAPGSDGGREDVSTDVKGKTIEFKKAGVKITVDAVINGYMADILVRYIYAAGMQNVMVKVGNVFRGVGQGLNGPWKIQVQEDSTTYARHALNLTVSDTAIATISSTQLPGRQVYDPRSRKSVATQCKGATIVMNEAALAEGLAYAIMIAGPKDGMKLLERVGNSRGLIVDTAGTFFRRGL